MGNKLATGYRKPKEWKEVEKTTEYKLKTPWAEYSRTTKKVPKEQPPAGIAAAERGK